MPTTRTSTSAAGVCVTVAAGEAFVAVATNGRRREASGGRYVFTALAGE